MLPKITVFWFRRDLRLADNAGLFHALKSGREVLLLFVFDSDALGGLHHSRDKSLNFMYEAVLDIKNQCEAKGSSLLVKLGRPEDVLRDIAGEYDVESVFANREYEPRCKEQDERIAKMLAGLGIVFKTFKDRVFYEKGELLKNDGSAYTTFTPYSRKWKQSIAREGISSYDSESYCDFLIKTEPFIFPSTDEIGFENDVWGWSEPVIPESIISNYHKTRDIPSLRGTTMLGVHLRYGTISIRQLVEIGWAKNETWLNELIWRDFFMMILDNNPRVVTSCFKPKYEAIKWRNNEEEFGKWCRGETGYPIVDAGMRQLKTTGFMHNRARMITSSFLCKHLLIDWRWGEAYFAEKLLDYELSSNNGNWQWAAGCGCDAVPYFRIFSPHEQTKRFDPSWLYIKQWVADVDAPHYPKPIVEHTMARMRALRVYKEGIGNNLFQ